MKPLKGLAPIGAVAHVQDTAHRDPTGMPLDRSHPLWAMRDDPAVTLEEFDQAALEWEATLSAHPRPEDAEGAASTAPPLPHPAEVSTEEEWVTDRVPPRHEEIR
jgi:hypothetical protein